MSDSLQSEQVAQPVKVPDSTGTIPALKAPLHPEQTRAAAPAEAEPAHEVQSRESDTFRAETSIDAAQADQAEEVNWDAEVAPNAGPTTERRIPLLGGRRKGRRLVRREEALRTPFTPEQRLLILDTWQRSGLPAADFATLVGLSKHTLYAWKKRFDEQGPAGLMETTRPHPDKPRRFERARPNQLWQTDLFTFMLKRQNRRVYLVAFMDDHSRFILGYGLHASASGALVPR